MKKTICGVMLALSVFCLAACGQTKDTKPYMGGHSFGDSKQAVESAGNAEQVMDLSVGHWIYMYTTDEKLKGVVYEVAEGTSLEDVVKAFEETYGKGTKGFRGDNQEYTEYSWVDDNANVYVMKKSDEGNVIVQIMNNGK